MIFLALKYLLARKRQTFLTLLGIFFGTAAYICISGIMLGFREYFVNQLINNSPHVLIQPREEFLTEHSLDSSFFGVEGPNVFWNPPPSGRQDSAIIESPQSWYERLRLDPRVAAFTPQLKASVIFSNGKATATSTITGSDPLQQVKVTTIGDYLVEGSFSDLAAGGSRVIIGQDLKAKLGVGVGQNVLISSGKGAPVPFKVVGIYKTGNRLNDNLAYGALSDIQGLNRTPNRVNEIAVKLKDYTQARVLANTWSSFARERVESWDELNANIFSVFRIQDAVRFLSVGAILVVASFGIYNVLNMTVMQKRRDVAILRSMGFESSDVVSLFFTQGLILGVSGALMGLLCGYLLCLYLQTIPFGGGTMGGTGYLMISFQRGIYIQACSLSLVSALVASLLPARSAGKLSPIEIIRSGAE